MKTRKLLSLALAAVVLSMVGVAGAQQPPAATPAPPPEYGPAVTLEQAKKVMAGAEAEAKKNKWNVVITIVDSSGHLVLSQRLDGTQWGSVDVAFDKAHSAVAFRRPSKVFADLIAQGGANTRLLNLRGASLLEGGIPLVMGGKLIGGIGVSGVTGQQDQQIAQAGVDALGK